MPAPTYHTAPSWLGFQPRPDHTESNGESLSPKLNPSPASHQEDRGYHFPSWSIPRLSILEAFTNRMKRVSKPKQSKIFPGTCGNLTKSAYELKRFKNVSWMWSERDQKVAKQREGCTLHSDTGKCTLLLRQPLITLWLLDYIQNWAFFGNGVPGSNTVILKLTVFADKFLQKRKETKKTTKPLSHKLLLCCQTPATFLLCWWIWLAMTCEPSSRQGSLWS